MICCGFKIALVVLHTSAPFFSMSSDASASVQLPRTTANGTLTKNKPPVWAIDSSGPSVQTPLPAKCARHTREGEVCCQELKGEDERQLLDPDVVRDVYVASLFYSGGGCEPTAVLSAPCPTHSARSCKQPLMLPTASSVSRTASLSHSRSQRACRPLASPSSSCSGASRSLSQARYLWALVVSLRRRRSATTTVFSGERPGHACSARVTERWSVRCMPCLAP